MVIRKTEEKKKEYVFIGGSGYGQSSEFLVQLSSGRRLILKGGDKLPDTLLQADIDNLLRYEKIREVQ